MKFKIFSVYEIIYKTIIYLIVAISTIAIVVYYLSLEDKSDTFIIATIYATFLFVVGLYLSSMDKKIDDKIYERKDYYLTLKQLNDVLNNKEMDLSTHKSTKQAIIFFQVFSGRQKKTEPDSDTETVTKPYIKENGFSFTQELDMLENSYMEESLKLQKKITDSINKYIDSNGIELKILGFQEMALLDTNYEDWCNQYIINADNDKKEIVIEYIYKIIGTLRSEIDEVEFRRECVKKYYEKCSRKVEFNIKRMESIYGNRLRNLIDTSDNIMESLTILDNKLNNILSIQENYEQKYNIKEELKILKFSIANINSKLCEIENAISETIDNSQYEIYSNKEKL